ncbi:histidine triad (HIT) protein [Nanobdella aerobiophila]|uniref:Histidine triad (HIT) protein n=1 Tax=Nanobdella aerobiophila TaxID=2586965 RepID=A0A915WS89_9ARCH|nr:HIT domain-containing protein [Nanobdella aerobiophila]BBL45671.1 histidine triad (HIT) protein [Nanobdella aerobiophila]
MDCIFCKIVNKEIPAYILYEDAYSIAFLDINPSNKGHSLFIPKKHFERLSEMDNEYIRNFYGGFNKFLRLFEDRISKDYNIIANNGKKAGQAIFHAHIHIIPQYEDDGYKKLFTLNSNKLTEKEAKEIVKKFIS